MKKIIFLFAIMFVVPGLVFAWTDATGSSDTATSQVDYRDAITESYDPGNNTFHVSITSNGAGTTTSNSTIVDVLDTTTFYTLPRPSIGKTYKVAFSSLCFNGVLDYTGKDVVGFSALVESDNTSVTAALSGGFIAGTAVIKDGVGYRASFDIPYIDPQITVVMPPDTTGYFVAKYYE